MNDDIEPTAAMFGAIDPVLDVSDSAIDEMHPVERLEARIEAALTANRGRPGVALSTRRALTAVLGVGLILALALTAFGADRGTAPPRATLSVTGQFVVPPRPPSASHVYVEPPVLQLGVDLYSVEGSNDTRPWCDREKMRATLRATAGSARDSWSGVVQLTNLGGTCAMSRDGAQVQAVTDSGALEGPVVPDSLTVVGVSLLHRGESVSFIVADSPATPVPAEFSSTTCISRAAHGFELVGRAPGWPTVRFLMGRRFRICAGAPSTLAVGVVTQPW